MQIGVETTILLAAISALGGVVTFLWRQIMSHYNETKKARDECEYDRTELWKQLAKQAGCNVNDMRPKNYGSNEDQRKTSTRNER